LPSAKAEKCLTQLGSRCADGSQSFSRTKSRSAITRAFNLALALLIVANVSCVVLETVEPIKSQFAAGFDAFERIATAIFAVEYVLRVRASVDFQASNYRDPVWAGSAICAASLRWSIWWPCCRRFWAFSMRPIFVFCGCFACCGC
jgi:hypothetical protein